MSYTELFTNSIKTDLVTEIKSMDLSKCSTVDLVALRNWATKVKIESDILTLEDEFVGYTYDNLNALTPKIDFEESRRGLRLVKITK